MSGADLVKRARERAPHLRAIISSGYPHQPDAADIEFLQKPFLPKMLAEIVERLLRS